VAGCCECGDEPSGSGATELVISYRPYQCSITADLPLSIVRTHVGNSKS
jgi:hypothetical protein